jgi:squalene-associated FAD-dependent desaturase
MIDGGTTSISAGATNANGGGTKASGSRPRVVVVGGGLAGLAAAIACVDNGAEVTLLEARQRLGGLTWSFERDGLVLDNGQHVYLRCCTEYRHFLERIGSAEHAPLQDRLALPVIRPGGKTGWLRKDNLPAPLHIGRSLLTYPHMGIAERLRVGPAALALRRLDLADPTLDEQSFGDWLAAHHQGPGSVEALWDLITLPTVNLRAGEASLALAAKVFQTGLLLEAAAADIGWSHIPLQALHGDAAARALERGGAAVHVKERVTEVHTRGGELTGVVAGGRPEHADAVILAVPHDVAANLLPEGALDGRAELRRLGSSPIVNVHVVYDRRITDLEVAAGIGTPVQFVFDRTEASGLAGRGGSAAARHPQCLAVSLSAADEYLGQKPAETIALVTEALPELFPAARHAVVLDAHVTRERLATFRGAPGTARYRVGTATRMPNLFLAGAWTDTGWPATMEGAVRSGNAAAEAALAYAAAGSHTGSRTGARTAVHTGSRTAAGPDAEPLRDLHGPSNRTLHHEQPEEVVA